MQSGDKVASLDGAWLTIDNVVRTGRISTVHNFRVADHHTYFVGSPDWGFAAWVHNTYKINGQVPRLGFDETHELLADYRRLGKSHLTGLVERGIINEADSLRVRALSIMQRLTDRSNRMLQTTPGLLDDLLTDPQLMAIGRKGDWLKPMFYGSVLEKAMVAKTIRNTPRLRGLFRHVGNSPGVDFIGLGPLKGMEFDITTALQMQTKPSKYGQYVLVPTYTR